MRWLAALLVALAAPCAAQTVYPAAPPMTYGTPTQRTIAGTTAYQCSNPLRACLISLTLSASAAPGTADTASIVIGATSAVATGTGTALQGFSASATNGLTTFAAAHGYTIALPPGWYFSVNTSAGTVNVSSAFDQVVG